MEYDQEGQLVNFISGLALGAIIGAGVALLSAPESGKRTRRKIRRAAGDIRDTAGERLDDLATDVKGRVDDAFKGAKKRLT